jgi:hypothetical protein
MPRAFNSLSSRNKFAKRHYEAIALAMQELGRYADNGATGKQVAAQAQRLLSDVFARDNGMFKRDRFERACVPGANVRVRSNGGAR